MINNLLIKVLPVPIRTRLAGRQNLQQILANTGWLFADRFLRFGLGIIVGAWVARYLGPDQFGLLNYATAFVALFTPVATLGLDNIVVRNIVRDPTCKSETLGTALTLKLLGSIIMLLVTFISISLLHPNDELTRLLVAVFCAGIIFQSFDTIDLWFQSQVNSRYTVIAKSIAFVAIVIVRVILILIRAPLIAFAFAGLAEIILGALGLLIMYRLNGEIITTWRFKFTRAILLMKDSIPLLLSGLAIMLYMKIDQIMLGELVGNHAVGVYSAAVRLSEVWYFIPLAIVSSTFPSIVEAKKMNEEVYKNRIQKLLNLMSALAITIAIPMTFLSSWLIKLLFGESFIEAGPVLAVHIWAGLSVFLGVAREAWMTTEGLMNFSFITTLGGAIINIILNFFLIPYYGVMGAAIATVIAYTSAGILMCFLFPRTQKIAFMMAKALIFRK